jgi:hypothetical protein
MFFVEGNAMLFYKRNEVVGLVPLKYCAYELRILAKKIGRARMRIREVTPASPTNTNFFPEGFCMVDYKNPQPPLPG